MKGTKSFLQPDLSREGARPPGGLPGGPFPLTSLEKIKAVLVTFSYPSDTVCLEKVQALLVASSHPSDCPGGLPFPS
jgi:hypothetical protein